MVLGRDKVQGPKEIVWLNGAPGAGKDEWQLDVGLPGLLVRAKHVAQRGSRGR